MPRYEIRLKGEFIVPVVAPDAETASSIAAEVRDIDFGDASMVEEEYIEEIDYDGGPYYTYNDKFQVVKRGE